VRPVYFILGLFIYCGWFVVSVAWETKRNLNMNQKLKRLNQSLGFLFTNLKPSIAGIIRTRCWKFAYRRGLYMLTRKIKPFEVDGFRVEHGGHMVGLWAFYVQGHMFHTWPELLPENPTIIDIGANWLKKQPLVRAKAYQIGFAESSCRQQVIRLEPICKSLWFNKLNLALRHSFVFSR